MLFRLRTEQPVIAIELASAKETRSLDLTGGTRSHFTAGRSRVGFGVAAVCCGKYVQGGSASQCDSGEALRCRGAGIQCRLTPRVPQARRDGSAEEGQCIDLAVNNECAVRIERACAIASG
jgi:hypothetical protein